MAIQDVRSRFQTVLEKTHLSNFYFFLHSQFVSIYERLKSDPLTLIFLVHFVPTTWGVQGSWSSNSYLFYNSFFLLLILWCIQDRESKEPAIMALVVNAFSVLFDIVVLAQNYPNGYNNSFIRGGWQRLGAEQFSAAMAIVNLIFRLFSIAILRKQWIDRKDASAGFKPCDNKQLSKPDVKLLQIDDVSVSREFNHSLNI